jgi:hypothetical protein
METIRQDPRSTARFSVPQMPDEPQVELPATNPPKNLVWAHAMLGILLGILFVVAFTAPGRPVNPIAAPEFKIADKPAPTPAAPPADTPSAIAPAPVFRDMGTVTTGTGGLKGHLTTSWSEKLTYHLTVGPENAAQQDAFALAVSNSPRPLSIELDLKSAAGQVVCDQPVVLKYDPAKSMKTGDEYSRLAARELERERTHDVFQNDLSRDGKIESISAQGTIPCPKKQYDTVAFWSFASEFPDLRAASKAKSPSISRPAAAAATLAAVSPRVESVRKALHHKELNASTPTWAALPSAPADLSATGAVSTSAGSDPSLVAVKAPESFVYRIEGDDDVVAYDPAQGRIETSAGNTFYVDGTQTASTADSELSSPTMVHYRCDQSASCTLYFTDSTVLHATRKVMHFGPLPVDSPTTVAEVSMPAPGSPDNASMSMEH